MIWLLWLFPFSSSQLLSEETFNSTEDMFLEGSGITLMDSDGGGDERTPRYPKAITHFRINGQVSIREMTVIRDLNVPPGAFGEQYERLGRRVKEYPVLLGVGDGIFGVITDDGNKTELNFVHNSQKNREKYSFVRIFKQPTPNHDYRFEWVKANDRLLDPSTIFIQKQNQRICQPHIAPGLFIHPHAGSFMGVANWDTRQFFFVHNNLVELIHDTDFDNEILILTKQFTSWKT